jgi:hypothetical protein
VASSDPDFFVPEGHVKYAIPSKRFSLCAALLSAAIFAAAFSQASATTIAFDDLPSPATAGSVVPNGYAGLTWTNFYYLNGASKAPSGFANGVVSTPNVAFNGGGNVASVSAASPFQLVSFELTSAWDNGLIVSIVGSFNGAAIESYSAIFNTAGPTLASLNWTGISEVSFAAICFPGLCANAGFPGSGTYFALDNLTLIPSVIFSPIVPTPLPAALPLFAGGLGVLGLVARRRKWKVAAAV